jgi:hypothetical protein
MIAYKLITTKKYPKQLPICKTKVGVFTPIKLAGLVQMLSTTYYSKEVTKHTCSKGRRSRTLIIKNEIEKEGLKVVSKC